MPGMTGCAIIITLMGREEERLEAYRRNVVIFAAVIILILSFMIIRPFIIAILSAAALAYIFYPMYLMLMKKTHPKIASLITCITIILLVLIPMAFITFIVTLEVRSWYVFLKEYLNGHQVLSNGLPPFLSQWSGYLPQFKEIAADLAGQLIGLLQNIIRGVPHVILNIFITIFSIYYFLVHGRDIYRFFSGLVPISEARYKQILMRFDDLSRGMIMGQIVVGIIQGLLAWAGFLFLQVPNTVLLAVLTAVISIIPLLGAAIVWVPVAGYLFLIGMGTGEYWRAIALLLYGTFVISLVDNFLKPKIVGDHAKIHPLIILFGILGGLQLFGLPGILIGPLVLTIFDVVIEIYKEAL